MSSLVKVVAGGMAASFLLAAATRAAPLVLDDEAMSGMRTSYRLVELGQPAIKAGVQASAPVPVAVPLTATRSRTMFASAGGAFRPVARPNRGVSRTTNGPDSTTATPQRAGGPANTLTQTLSDSEADQVTGAGFLFPIVGAINARVPVARPLVVFTPVARTTSFTRQLVVVPRPSPSMIVRVANSSQ